MPLRNKLREEKLFAWPLIKSRWIILQKPSGPQLLYELIKSRQIIRATVDTTVAKLHNKIGWCITPLIFYSGIGTASQQQ